MDEWNLITGDFEQDEFLNWSRIIQFYSSEKPKKKKIPEKPISSDFIFLEAEDKLGLRSEFWDLQGPQEFELTEFYRKFTLFPECDFWEKYWAVSKLLGRICVRHGFIWRGDKLFLKFSLKPKHHYAPILLSLL